MVTNLVNQHMANQRRQVLPRSAIADSAAPLVPIQVGELPADPSTGSGRRGRIDIVLGADRWITVHGQVSREALQTALEVLVR